ncbi:MAG: sialidase family protein [Planctomycetota bacterium]|nr:sialidase family protein [Planctomycetota bacterium]MDA1180021.1 sialidase family protein [Planctomycetota bacterium]
MVIHARFSLLLVLCLCLQGGSNCAERTKTGPHDSDRDTSDAAVSWPTVVRQLNGSQPLIELPAVERIVTKPGTFRRVQLPYLVYLPERDRLLMSTLCDGWARLTHSDDHGVTWSELRHVYTDDSGKPDVPRTTPSGLRDVGHNAIKLNYLGAGKVLLAAHESDGGWLWSSQDYGDTWGDRTRAAPSLDIGHTINWYENGEPLTKPSWPGYSEISIIRAKNGNLVAACRKNTPFRFEKLGKDHYSGLGVSVSKDNGVTWSNMNLLYDWGRHHPSVAILENGDLVMSYVVRLGYPDTVDGYAQYGIEAVVSHDHGESWDLDHRYLLSVWHDVRWQAPQLTSTVALPDNSLLTAFNRVHPVPQYVMGENAPSPPGSLVTRHWTPVSANATRTVAMVHWRLNIGPVNSERTIMNAPPDSDLRNKLDPHPIPGWRLEQIRKSGNIAVKELGANVTASAADQEPNDLLDDGGYSHSVVTLQTMPAWIEITWPQSQCVHEIRLQPGAPNLLGSDHAGSATTDFAPLEYRLQYRQEKQWVDLIPPVTNAQRFAEWAKTAPGLDSLSFHVVYKFAPVHTTAVRLVVTRSTDLGFRGSSATSRVVPDAQRETILRGIEVIAAP